MSIIFSETISSRNEAEFIFKTVKEYNPLHSMLDKQLISDRQKRAVLMAKLYDLCQIRNIYLEIGGLHQSLYYYKSPQDLFKIFFGDKNVFQQYLNSGKRCELYDGCGDWFGDFFQSKAYRDVMKTIPLGDGYPPLLLGLYRYQNMFF